MTVDRIDAGKRYAERPNTLTDGFPTIPAECFPTAFRWSTATDNYDPPRNYASGVGTAYRNPTHDGDVGVRIETGADNLRELERSLVLIDNGRTVGPYYCAGWHAGNPSPSYPEGHRPYVLFKPFPVNPNGRTRPDNGRIVDFSGWMLGPRRTYHLKVSEVSA